VHIYHTVWYWVCIRGFLPFFQVRNPPSYAYQLMTITRNAQLQHRDLTGKFIYYRIATCTYRHRTKKHTFPSPLLSPLPNGSTSSHGKKFCPPGLVPRKKTTSGIILLIIVLASDLDDPLSQWGVCVDCVCLLLTTGAGA